jgi:hypothetical protein
MLLSVRDYVDCFHPIVAPDRRKTWQGRRSGRMMRVRRPKSSHPARKVRNMGLLFAILLIGIPAVAALYDQYGGKQMQ